MPTYPIYYGTQRVTIERLESIFVPRMHPEFARRLFPWIVSKGGAIGIGSGFRFSNPVGATFAPDGESFHQYQTFTDQGRYYAAVDLVYFRGEGLTHRSPRWGEVPWQGSDESKKVGLHCNVGGPTGDYNWAVAYGGEPWHMQPIEIDGWGRWVRAGKPGLQLGYPIHHGDTTPPPVIIPPPNPTGGSVYVDPPTLRPGAADRNWTEKLQAILPTFGQDVGPIDGVYGPRTQEAVKAVQRFFGLTVDAVVGARTWGVVLGVAP